jgi:hypothetical protein
MYLFNRTKYLDLSLTFQNVFLINKNFECDNIVFGIRQLFFISENKRVYIVDG